MDITCLRCMSQLHHNYHLIFDETGVELQLDKLLADHFEIFVEEDVETVQALCEECVNKLIELYDLTQKNQEQQHLPENEYIEEVEMHIKEEMGSASDTMELYSESEENEIADNSINEDDVFLGFNDNSQEYVKSFENVQFIEELGGMTIAEYVKQVVKSELEEIDFNQNTICKLCDEVLTSHTAVIMHVSTAHETESKQYPCISCDKTGYFSSVKDLAHHIVLKHYDLDTINIYCTCPECTKRFSSFVEFNKHSCYKEKVGNRLIQECSTCSKHFSSNKRYRFHLQFHLEKHRAKACFICDIMFSDENDFYEHIMYAHEKKDSLICKKCDRVCSSKLLYENHMKLHKAIRSFQCDYCSKTYLYKQMLMNHIQRHHSGKQLHNCKICEKSLASKHLLKRHMQVKHNEDTEANMFVCSMCGLVGATKEDAEEHIADIICNDADLASEQLKIAYACEFCENAFNNVENLKKHRSIHSGDKYTCWICASVYSEFKKLKTHIITHDKYNPIQETFPVNRHYVCNFETCTQSYLTWPSLRAHKFRHEADAKFSCEICNQTFRTQSNLNNHLKAHDNNEQYPCQFCSKMCASAMALAVHISRRHNNNCKTCPTCKSTYPTEETLEEHIRTNHIELKCQQCGKETKSKRNLDVHIRMVHAKVKRYFCSTCDKGYYNKSDLKVHEKTSHSELHKYKCEQCDFSSSYEVSFKAHVLKHGAEKPFKCEECAREFTRKACFKLHMLRHTDVKPFDCPVEGCGRSFVTRGIRNTHLRENHPGWVISSSPTKTTPQEEGIQSSTSTDYVILDLAAHDGPLQMEVGEQGLVLFEGSNVDQDILLEYTDSKSDLVLLNHSDGGYNIPD